MFMEHPLTTYRRDKSLTQEAFGVLVGASKGMVSKWEAGGVLPRPIVIARIEDITGGDVSASHLVRFFNAANGDDEAAA